MKTKIKVKTLEAIKDKIQESGIKKKVLAEKIGISKEYLSGILTGRIRPNNVDDILKNLTKELW